MFNSSDIDSKVISTSISKHGVTPGGIAMMRTETVAATESISSGMYIAWLPHPSASSMLHSDAFEGIRSNTSQCCRIGSETVCMCGHALRDHQAVKMPKSSGYIKPPNCLQCKCKGYNYCPSRPEECGQWWLPRRKDFNLTQWRSRIRMNPHDYSCIGCELKVSDHETLFETRSARIARGAAVDEDYLPLSDDKKLREQVFSDETTLGGRPRKVITSSTRISSRLTTSDTKDFERLKLS